MASINSNTSALRISLLGLTALVMLVILASCKQGDSSNGFGGSAVDKIGDPHFQVLTVASYNYTDSNIYDVYLSDNRSNDIDTASLAAGSLAAPQNATGWEYPHPTAAVAWDDRWMLPKTIHVFWESVFDKAAYEAAHAYNAYESKDTQAGSAWCEYEVKINTAPDKTKNEMLVLNFYPDGTVSGELQDSPSHASVDFRDRRKLSTLTGSHCVRQIPNPKFGKKAPRFTE